MSLQLCVVQIPSSVLLDTCETSQASVQTISTCLRWMPA